MSEQSCLLSFASGKPMLTIFKDLYNSLEEAAIANLIDLLDTYNIPKVYRRRLQNTQYGVKCILNFNLAFSKYINSLNLKNGLITLNLEPCLESLREGDQYEFNFGSLFEVHPLLRRI